ncbi:MAG: shikimate kinase [Rothia mucilaginosa]|uniref:shikimate kinase n=1 Tax=Rothia mucilaginosa TaxID=43675 RepID=UPI0026F11BEB|nr:shikimate kinase [Rothia mucilaginosa]MBS5102836.1 shikimate kinase [Rothia mucilaginosa]
MPLPAESEGRGAKGRGSGEVSVEQGVRPVASSPLARIAAATQRARGGASPRPEPGVSAAAEQSVEAAGAGVRETAAREAGASVSSASVSSVRPASRVPTPADLMRSGTRPLPAAATASTQGVRLYASSVSEDADPALGLDEDLRLKLLSALQGMGTAEEESRKEPAQADAPKLAPAHPVAVPAAEPAKPVRPTPALFGKVQVSAAESVAESVAEEIVAVDSAEAAATIEARAASEAELNAELEAAELKAGELEESARIHPQQVREMHENFAEQSRPIVLIGPMAAGKTYIGTHLARFYGYEFLDADQLIVERYGEVSEIFEIFGEAHFRELERKTIEEVLTSPVYRNTVFSLGGGAPMTDSVAELLKDECVVYILVDAETVTPRITGNKTRPLLQPNPVERWTDIFERRRSRYEELAHFTLDARGGRPITEMTAEIQAYVTASRKARANNS